MLTYKHTDPPSISNFSFLGSLEVAQNYFPRGWVGVITRIKANLSSTELGLTSQLELSLAKSYIEIQPHNNGSKLGEGIVQKPKFHILFEAFPDSRCGGGGETVVDHTLV